MAKFLNLQSTCMDVVHADFYKWQAEAQCFRAYECRAAIRIQSWYRGLRVRAYLRYLKEATELIQRIWRGYRARVYAFQLRRVKVNHLRYGYYNEQAVKIQRVWRGYWSRRHLFDYKSRKRYFENIQKRNEEVKIELDEMSQELNMKHLTEVENYRDAELQRFICANHHLVSTYQQPGIYNSPYLLCRSELEQRLRSVKFAPRRALSDDKQKVGADAVNTVSSETDVREFQSSCGVCKTRYNVVLPPITQKPQGPFRDPCEVRRQRLRPLSPPLRTSSVYGEGLKERRNQLKDEEWAKRITSDMFELYSKPSRLRPCGKEYERLLSSSAAYTLKGDVEFRQDQPHKWMSPCEDFKRVLPPIAVFDRIGKNYSKGQV